VRKRPCRTNARLAVLASGEFGSTAPRFKIHDSAASRFHGLAQLTPDGWTICTSAPVDSLHPALRMLTDRESVHEARQLGLTTRSDPVPKIAFAFH
jgi:hypothetical protein